MNSVHMYDRMYVYVSIVCAKRAYYSYLYGWNQLAASGILAVQAGRGGNDQDVTFSSLQSGTALVTRKNHHSGSGSKKVSQFVQI